MDFWVGRQPILGCRMNVEAYELLYRSGSVGAAGPIDGDQATAQTIVHAFVDLDLPSLTGGKRAFINFTREMLVGGIAELLPPDAIVVEVLETVDADDQVVEACTRLKHAGYQLALDDYLLESEQHQRLLPLADVVKVDFMGNDLRAREEAVRRLKSPGRLLLAEKVETEPEFEWARQHGYTLHQGYFFARPTTVQGQQIPPAKLNYLRLLNALRNRELDLDAVEAAVRDDVSLTHRLLRLLNSASFSWRQRIGSVRHALVALGEDATRKWLSLLCTMGIATDRPAELVVLSLTRARFLEEVSGLIGLEARSGDLFFMGMVSLLPAILAREAAEVYAQLALPDDVRQALMGGGNVLASALRMALVFERAEWSRLPSLCADLGTTPRAVSDAYIRAARHATRALGTED
ncbi:MAG TPA: HDOD domain-containing protein [Armatimonadota bacterium]|nr:HDOD domain-containing protein [Armatimonadota bacterium]